MIFHLVHCIGNCEAVVVVEVLRDQLVHVVHAFYHFFRVVPDEKWSKPIFIELRKPLNEATLSEVTLLIPDKMRPFSIFRVSLLEVRMLDDFV